MRGPTIGEKKEDRRQAKRATNINLAFLALIFLSVYVGVLIALLAWRIGL